MKKELPLLLILSWLFFSGCNKDEGPFPDIPTEPGTYELSIEAGGRTRWFTVVIPSGYTHLEKRPMVVFFHEEDKSMADSYTARLDLRDQAEADSWILVFPNGTNAVDNRTGVSTWKATHCCLPAFEEDVDDVAFVKSMVAQLKEKFLIDEKRIYATGFSNGAMLVHLLGAASPETFTAIAAVAGTAGGFPEGVTGAEIVINPQSPLPVLIMHAWDDLIVNYGGGWSSASSRYDRSVYQTAKIWLDENGCNQIDADTLMNNTAYGKVWEVNYTGCAEGSGVRVISMEQAGHSWPSEDLTGFGATNEVVRFFKEWEKE